MVVANGKVGHWTIEFSGTLDSASTSGVGQLQLSDLACKKGGQRRSSSCTDLRSTSKGARKGPLARDQPGRPLARRSSPAPRRQGRALHRGGGYRRFGIATTRMPAACAARMPLPESSIGRAALGLDAEAPRRLEEDVGRRLAARDLLGGDDRPRRAARGPDFARTASMTRRFDDEATREPERPGEPRDRLDRAVDQRELLLVAREHPTHDLVVDLLRATR